MGDRLGMDLEPWLSDTCLGWLLPLVRQHLWPAQTRMTKLAPLPAAWVPCGGSGDPRKSLLFPGQSPRQIVCPVRSHVPASIQQVWSHRGVTSRCKEIRGSAKYLLSAFQPEPTQMNR